MKINKIFLVSIFVLAIITVGAVGATDELTATDDGGIGAPVDDVEVDDEDSNLEVGDDSSLSDDEYITVTLEDRPIECGGSAYLDVNVTDGLTGTLTYYVDDPEYGDSSEIDTEYGNSWSESVYINSLGTHTIYAKYHDGNRPDKTFSFPINVNDFRLKVYYDDYDDQPIPYGENFYLSVSIPSAAKGTLTVTVNGKSYNVYYDEWDGWAEDVRIWHGDVAYGVNQVTAKFVPKDKNSQFKEKTVTTNITVMSSFNFRQSYVNYNVAYGKGVISLLLPSDATGNLLISIDDNNYTVEPDNGKYVFNIPKLDLGSHEVSLEYDGNDYKVYCGESWDGEPNNRTSFTLTVDPSFDAPERTWANDNVTVSVEMPEKYNGTAKIDYNYWDEYDNFITVDVGSIEIKNGMANASFKLPAGSYRVDAEIDWGDNHYETDKSISVLEDDPNWNMNLEVRKMIRKVADATLAYIPSMNPNSDNGEFILEVDGNPFDVEINGNQVTIDASILDIGTHTFTLIFLGDGYFLPTNESGSFEVNTYAVTIPETNVMDDASAIAIELSKKTTGTITVYANGTKIYSGKIIEDAYDNEEENCWEMSVYLYDLKYGISDISVRLNNKEIANGKVNSTYTLEIATDEIRYGGDKLYIDRPEMAKQKLTVLIDGVSYKVTTVYYEGSDETYIDTDYVMIEPDLAIGTHNITLSYAGDKKYPARTVKTTFEVIPKIEFVEVASKGEGVSLILPDDAKGNLTVKINDKIYANVKAAGNVSINFDNLSFGHYTMQIAYTGDDYDVRPCEDVDLTVNPEFIVPEKMLWKGDDVISISLDSNVTGRLELWCHDDEFVDSAKLVDGKASISLSKLSSGLKRISVYLQRVIVDENGDEYEQQYDQEFTINIVNPIVAKDTSALYSENTKYTVNIRDVDKNPVASGKVTFYIYDGNKKLSTKTVNIKNGVATLSYKITQGVKTYKIKTVFGKVSVTKKLTVKHVISLSKAKVKKSAKKLVLTATLKKVNGKYLKNKVITFKFSGKTYKIKTNSKGVAKATVPSVVLKKLKPGKYITYQATYMKDTVKQKVIISK